MAIGLMENWLSEIIVNIFKKLALDFLEMQNVLFGFLFDAVFDFEKFAFPLLEGNLAISIADSLMEIGLSLITAKFLFKLFNIYILESGGDSSTPPLNYLTGYIKAMIMVFIFGYLYSSIFVPIVRDINERVLDGVTNAVGEMGDYSSLFSILSGAGFSLVILFIVFIAAGLILFVMNIISGVELFILRIALPLACIGLIDGDDGIFKPYFKSYIEAALTTLARILLARLSIVAAVASNVQLGLSNVQLGLLIGIAMQVFAIFLPKTIQKLTSQSSGSLGMTVNSAMQLKGIIGSLSK